MGSCLSKKGSSSSSTKPPTVTQPSPPFQPMLVLPVKPPASKDHDHDDVAAAGHPNFTKKEVFLIKHRNSHDSSISPLDHKSASAEAPPVPCHPTDNHDKQPRGIGTPTEPTGLRTSSCTKEEVDAILIQCGRLSRSSSGNFGARSYSGSKRSYDFDNHDDDADGGVAGSVPRGLQFPDSNEDDPGRRRPHRRPSRPSPTRDHGGRRRTPSRERDQQRSSSTSRERRTSRSPGRRADTTTANASSLSNAPAKMVSVPATVNGTDKTKSNLEPKAAAVRRISVKRNQGGAGDTTRATASPRSQSPAKQTTSTAKAAENDGQQLQPQPSLSRSSSRKAEKSPYRRNPLSEIDPNTYPHPQPHKFHPLAIKENEAPQVKAKWKSGMAEDTQAPGEGKSAAAHKTSQSRTVNVDLEEDAQQTLARIKSSREFGIEKDHRQGSYTSLLLQDIQKFHQNQAGGPPASSFSLPPCVVKACSIYDAVADLNSKRSCIYDDDPTALSLSGRINIGTSFIDAKSEARDPFVESELAVDDDLVEPSILKYVTVQRGGMLLGRGEEEQQESSGSNTLFLGSAGAELGVADSPNCGTSISAGTRTSAISGKGLLYG